MLPTMSMSYKLELWYAKFCYPVQCRESQITHSRGRPGTKQCSSTGQAYDFRGAKSFFPHYYTKHCSQYETVSLWFWFSPRHNSDTQLHIQPHFMRPKITPPASKTPNPIAHTYDVTERFLVRMPEAHKHWQGCWFCNLWWQKDCC